MRTVFTSNISFQDAAFKAKMQGFTPVGQARNPKGSFVIFAEKQNTVVNNNVGNNRRVWW